MWGSPNIIACGTCASYPTDGRETIYAPYEQFARTDTVDAFLNVYNYLYGEPHWGEYALPENFMDYLQQRTLSIDAVREAHKLDRIDEFGKIVRTERGLDTVVPAVRKLLEEDPESEMAWRFEQVQILKGRGYDFTPAGMSEESMDDDVRLYRQRAQEIKEDRERDQKAKES